MRFRTDEDLDELALRAERELVRQTLVPELDRIGCDAAQQMQCAGRSFSRV